MISGPELFDDGGLVAFIVRARKVRFSYDVDTRLTLERAIRNLEELAEEAHSRAKSKYQPISDRQRWARIEATIYQTIGSLAKNYDDMNISEKLDELGARVEELMEKDRASGGSD
jgi:transcriptional accessory protein Tex/SPT6